jgi:hypothetical protein
MRRERATGGGVLLARKRWTFELRCGDGALEGFEVIFLIVERGGALGHLYKNTEEKEKEKRERVRTRAREG